MAEDHATAPDAERRARTDRRQTQDPGYTGPERRHGDRRATPPPRD